MLTPAMLRNVYLRGMPLLDAYGRPMPDTSLQTLINNALASFQRKHNFRLQPTIIKLGEGRFQHEAQFNPQNLPIEYRDALDYDPRAFEGNRHVRLTLPIGPARRVLGVGLQLTGQTPLYEFPVDVDDPQRGWARLRKRKRRLSIYPGASMVFPTNLFALGAVSMAGGASIPNGWQVVYEAGFSEDELTTGEFADVLGALGKLAAIEVLVPGSVDLYMTLGVSGLNASVDGLSTGTQLAGGGTDLRYGPLITAYTESISAWETSFTERARGVKVGFL